MNIEMTLKLRKALLPLHLVSKVLGIGPFSLGKLKPSRSGSAITICQAVSYSIFHIWMSNNNISAEDGSKNMVRQLIDSYNRYSGFCAFCFLVVASILIQRKIVNVIQNIEKIDEIFQKKMNVTMDNQRWRRNVSLQMCLCICAISFFEWRNCLMFIQDSVPFSEHCLIMCLVPMYVIGITEIQFFAYLQLIRYRLHLLNKLLIDFTQEKNCHNDLNTVYDVVHTQSYSLERFYSQSKRKHFKIPTKSCIRRFNNNTSAKKHRPIPIIDIKPLEFGDFCNSITQIQYIYSMLERTVIILKLAYSPHLVVILVMKFTTLTSLLYFCCMVIIKIISGIPLSEENADQLFSSSAWICTFFVEIFLLCFSCTITTNETKKIGRNLRHVALRLDNACCKLKLKAFSIQLLFHDVEVKPFGLFNLDLNFMYGLVGAVCTYLIILVQFDLAQKAQQKNTFNVTVIKNL